MDTVELSVKDIQSASSVERVEITVPSNEITLTCSNVVIAFAPVSVPDIRGSP